MIVVSVARQVCYLHTRFMYVYIEADMPTIQETEDLSMLLSSQKKLVLIDNVLELLSCL